LLYYKYWNAGTQKGASIITSQLPVKAWYEYIKEPTLADAIMERMTAHANRITKNKKAVSFISLKYAIYQVAQFGAEWWLSFIGIYSLKITLVDGVQLRSFGAAASRQSRSETLLPWQRGYKRWQKKHWLAATGIEFVKWPGLLPDGQTEPDVICRKAND